jgi:hypothetical protein
VTCIVGLVAGQKVWIGGDSAGVSGWDMVVRADAKVFRVGAFLMGFTSSFRMGQLLRHSFVPPHHPEGVDDERFMVTTFVDAVRNCLKTGGFARTENSVESGGMFLVGYRGKLYRIEDDYQVGVAADCADAVGCGWSSARGSLHTSGRLVPNIKPEQRVRWALEAAERCSAGVRGPFLIQSI